MWTTRLLTTLCPLVFVVSAAAGFSFLAFAGTAPCDPVESGKVVAPEPASGDDFGYAVALSGALAVATAWGDDNGANNAGLACVFELDDRGAWALVNSIQASNPTPSAFFGWSCAASDETVVVGAPRGTGIVALSGSVYVFRKDSRGTWSEVALLAGSRGGVLDRFGEATSICGDTIAVGGRLENSIGIDAGAVHIFRETAPSQWSESAWIVADDAAAGAWFGGAVNVCGDRLIVGAIHDSTQGTNAGAAYVFREIAPGKWTQMAKLLAADGNGAEVFGADVAISGGNAFVGAPGADGPEPKTGAVYVFREEENGTWVQVQKLVAADAANDDSFGTSLALVGDRLLVGAHHYDVPSAEPGAAYLFRRDATGAWVQAAKIKASDGAPQDLFGFGVALTSTNGGDVALVGSHSDDDGGDSSGSAYFFELGCESIVGDLDGDGEIGSPDLEMLLADWGAVATCECDRSPGDLDGDGVVVGRDLGLLLGAWTR